jgi:hypothetical protein
MAESGQSVEWQWPRPLRLVERVSAYPHEVGRGRGQVHQQLGRQQRDEDMLPAEDRTSQVNQTWTHTEDTIGQGRAG